MATKNSCPFPALHLAVLALLLVIPTPADAQPPSGPSFSDGPYGGGYTVRINPAIAAIIIAFICGFFFLGFFSVYLRQCGSRGSGTRPSGAVESGAAASRASRRGLDPELLASFPTMKYADAKKHNKGKGALECAVCLCEFDDDDSLRLLPSCCHVFHVDCVDVWLDTHVTCPVCRANLAETAVAGAAAAVSCESMTAEDAGTAEERDLEAGQPPVQYRRWHSTGHEGAQVDRHTLRLPEHVMREIVTAAGLRRAASVVEPRLRGEASGRRGYRGGRSGRWGFLLRTFSVRRRADGTAAEGSSKRIFPTTDVRLSFGGGVGGEKSGSAREETRGVVGVKSESAREAEKGVKPEFGKEAEAEAEASSTNVAASTRQ